MNALVTGAAGFLGRHVVTALQARGCGVRALVRTETSAAALADRHGVDVLCADLRTSDRLDEAFDGMDVLVHLAAAMGGSGDRQLADTVEGTERLLQAMARSQTDRIVLASSMSVYDWQSAGRDIDEAATLETRFDRRDTYTEAKCRQEHLVRDEASRLGWGLTVFRPGFIWGPGRTWVDGVGLRLGPIILVQGPGRRLPLTHVENCATAFARAATDRNAAGKTYNVIDSDPVSAWQYAGDSARLRGKRAVRLPVPHMLGMSAARIADAVNRFLLFGKAPLPGVLRPARYAARFSRSRLLADELGKDFPDWQEHPYDRAIDITGEKMRGKRS